MSDSRQDARVPWLIGPVRTALVWIAVTAIASLAIKSVPITWGVVVAVAALVARMLVPRPSRPRRSAGQIAAYIAWVIASIVFICATLEIGARLFIYRESRGTPLYRPDTRYLFTLSPNAKEPYYYRVGPEELAMVTHQTSSQGLRDEVVGDKAPGEYRIALLGDSYTFGATVDVDQTIGRHLQRILEERYPGRAVRVINLGVGGTGPWQQLGRLRDVGFRFEPDLVLHQLFLGNDVENELTQTGQYLEAYDPDWQVVIDRWRKVNLSRFRAEAWLFEHSSAYAAFRRAVSAQSVYKFLQSGLRILPEAKRLFRKHSEPRPSLLEVDVADWYPKLERGFAMLVDDVAAAEAACEERGARYAVYNVPCHLELSDVEWARHARPDVSDFYDRGKGNRKLAEAMRERGIDFIPVFERFQADENPERFYHIFDGHTSGKGNRAIAEILADYIAAEGLLAPTNE